MALFVIEFLLRLTHRIELKLGLVNENLEGANGGSQLKAAAFYNTFDYVSGLKSAIQDEFLTKEFWTELSKYRTDGMFERGKDQEILGNKDLKGMYINVINGIRATPNQPISSARKILLFGGSTIFSYEVRDDKTPSACLQNKINELGFKYKVENYGVGGASIGDCFRRLRLIEISQNDIVVILFGDNDIGINAPRKLVGRGMFKNVPFWGEFLSVFRARSKIIDWLFLETVEQVFTDLKENPDLLSGTIQTYYEIADFLKARKVKFIFLLQPNLYTKKSENSFENWLKNTYPKHWESIVLAGYNIFMNELSEDENFETATDIYDSYEESYYLDWAHVNSRGNEIIAERMLDSLLDRGLLAHETAPNL